MLLCCFDLEPLGYNCEQCCGQCHGLPPWSDEPATLCVTLNDGRQADACGPCIRWLVAKGLAKYNLESLLCEP